MNEHILSTVPAPPGLWDREKLWNVGNLCVFPNTDGPTYLATENIIPESLALPKDRPYLPPPLDQERWTRLSFDPTSKKVDALVEVIEDLIYALERMVNRNYGVRVKDGSLTPGHPITVIAEAKQKMEMLKQL